MKAKTKDVLNINEIAKLLGLRPPDEVEWDDNGENYSAGYNEAIDEGLDEGEAEERGFKWQDAAQDEVYREYADAVVNVAEQLFSKHLLSLQPRLPRDTRRGTFAFEYRVIPIEGWDAAANEIRTTISGVGMFDVGRDLREFLSYGPWTTARQAVLAHLHVIKDWPEVYGSGSPSTMLDRALR